MILKAREIEDGDSMTLLHLELNSIDELSFSAMNRKNHRLKGIISLI